MLKFNKLGNTMGKKYHWGMLLGLVGYFFLAKGFQGGVMDEIRLGLSQLSPFS